MDISLRLKKEAKEAGLEWDVYAMANLIVSGFSEKDAYIAIFARESTAPEAYEIGKMRRIVSDPAFGAFVQKKQRLLQNKLKRAVEEASEDSVVYDDKLMDKDEVAKELLRIAKQLPVNSKERADILMKYSDLLQMKKDEVKEEEKLVHFYLPVSCYNCPLYHEAQLRGRNNSDINI